MSILKKIFFKKKILSRLEELNKELKGEYRISQRKVPYLLVQKGDVAHSVCYFGGRGLFRVFFPFPGSNQTRLDFSNERSVVAYFNSNGKDYVVHSKPEEKLSTFERDLGYTECYRETAWALEKERRTNEWRKKWDERVKKYAQKKK